MMALHILSGVLSSCPVSDPFVRCLTHPGLLVSRRVIGFVLYRVIGIVLYVFVGVQYTDTADKARPVCR
jgi:hypothetical protein